MPRVRSDDYDAKSLSIMDSAAALFAKVGYPNAKMQDIAQACGATKSMLYHYFPTKAEFFGAIWEAAHSDLRHRVSSLSAPTSATRTLCR